MQLIGILLAIVLVVILVMLAVVAIAFLWYRRGQRRADKHFGNAAALIRRRGGDPRFSHGLAVLADDPRTPSSAHTWLDRLIRYRRDAKPLAPEWVPVLGQFDEVAIESFMLRQAWRSLPPAVWAEHFPEDAPRPPVIARSSTPAEPRPDGAVGLAALLADLEQQGRHDELLHTLDRRLPPWPIGSVLIDAARELLELDRNLAAARHRGVPEPVTARLIGESRLAATSLWDLADRLAVTASFGISTEGIETRLQQEQERVQKLGVAIREARAGLAELTLAGAASRNNLDRAERRFRALARTAEELQAIER